MKINLNKINTTVKIFKQRNANNKEKLYKLIPFPRCSLRKERLLNNKPCATGREKAVGISWFYRHTVIAEKQCSGLTKKDTNCYLLYLALTFISEVYTQGE